ncbi:MAG: MalY/PatB family protein [Thiohalomonadaceae bacterium]
MSYDFHTAYQRPGIGCEKYDKRQAIFGTESVIPLWVADMEFASPDSIQQALIERAKLPSYGYAERMAGWTEAVGQWLARQHHWQIDPAWLLPTAGVVPSLALAIQTLSQPGDGVIIQPPVYFPFFGLVRETQRQLLLNPLREVNGRYQMDLEQLEKLARQARVLILCNPHNPGGRAWSAAELAEVARICASHGVSVLSDEIHMDLSYPGITHTPFAQVAEDCSYLMLSAAGKTFNTAGIGGGYAVIPDAVLRQDLQRLQNTLHLNGENIFSLLVTETAYRHGHDWPTALMTQIAANRDRVYAACQHSAITPMPPEATYLLWLDCRALGMDDQALEQFFIHRAGLGLSAGHIFGEQGSGYMRINLASTPAIIEQAMQQLEAALAGL